MKIKYILPILFIFLFVAQLFAQEFPEKPARLVNDYTNTLSEGEKNSLEQKLVAFDDSTSNQVAIVIIKSVGVYDVNDYTARLAEKWGVGHKGKNNGLVILVALGDRKISIQTGYGLEGAVPDAIAKRIIENEIKPEFKLGNYYQGLDKATDAIISYTKGEYKNEDQPKKGVQKTKGFPWAIIIIIIIIFLISKRGGGGGGRGGQIIGGRGSASPFWWMLLGSQMGRSRGGSGWGGFSGGGGGFGGGGGGFGGFGGGSFGGGGASGDW